MKANKLQTFSKYYEEEFASWMEKYIETDYSRVNFIDIDHHWIEPVAGQKLDPWWKQSTNMTIENGSVLFRANVGRTLTVIDDGVKIMQSVIICSIR